MQREATAVWRGEVKSGKGSLSTESTVLKEAQKQCKTAWSPFATVQNLSAKVLSKLAGENPPSEETGYPPGVEPERRPVLSPIPRSITENFTE
jgi:hypothetical protein